MLKMSIYGQRNKGDFTMFLTKECDYGLRIVRALSGGEKSTAEQICAAENIPGQFAYKILKKLERADYLRSSRGRDGGYWLTRSVDDISIYDIVTAIDNNLFINECLRDDHRCVRNTADDPCTVHTELGRIQGVLIKELRQKAFSEIVVVT
jgi:Rrf2 family protein